MRDNERLELAARAAGNGEAGADGIEAVVHESRLSLTRFTKSAIHQNLDEANTFVQIRAVVEGRAGWATTNARDDAALERTRKSAVAQAKFAPKPQIAVKLPQPATYSAPNDSFDAATAAATPVQRAAAAAKIFEVASDAGAWAAGYVSSSAGGIAIANTNGVRAAFSSTDAEINVKCVAPGASGYAEALDRRFGALDAHAIAQRAARKARDAGTLGTPETGEWTVILEPAAFGELMAYLLAHFSADRVHEGASFLSDGLDRAYVSENVTLLEDFAHPLHAGIPFDAEATPTQKVTLIEHGNGKDFVTNREWAERMNRRNTGHHPFSGESPFVRAPVVLPGSRSREELIASTKRGILITRFWYIRVVDFHKTIVTGMTRDGTFSIEDGKLAGGCKNLRYNVSLLELLRSCEFSNESVRTGGYSYQIVVPAAKFDRFTVSSVTSY